MKLTGLNPPPIDVRLALAFALLLKEPTLGMLPGLMGATLAKNTYKYAINSS